MKKKCFMLTAIVMLCWVASSQAAITTTMVNGDLIVQTDQEGVAGLKGCDAKTAKKRAAYLFELQQQEGAIKGTCRAGQGGRWKTIGTRESEDGQAVFENLPDGYFRVICRVGKAIGCEIENVENGIPNRSIVYELEKNVFVDVKAEANTKEAVVSENGLLVYPNPTTDEISILLKNEIVDSEISISILDLLGKRLHEEKHLLTEKGELLWKIPLNGFSSGAYVVLLQEKGGAVWQEKFVVIND